MYTPLAFIGGVDSPPDAYQAGQVVITPEIVRDGWPVTITRHLKVIPRTAALVIHMPEAVIKGQPYTGRGWDDVPPASKAYFTGLEFASLVKNREVWFYLGYPSDWSDRGIAKHVWPWVEHTGVSRFIIDASSGWTKTLAETVRAFPGIELMAEAFPLDDNTKPHPLKAEAAARLPSVMNLRDARAMGLSLWKAVGEQHLIVHGRDAEWLTRDRAAHLEGRGFTLGSHGIAGAKVLAAAKEGQT